MQQRFDSTRRTVEDMNDLIQRLIDIDGVERGVIDNASDQRCRRRHACLRAVGHFKYLL